MKRLQYLAEIACSFCTPYNAPVALDAFSHQDTALMARVEQCEQTIGQLRQLNQELQGQLQKQQPEHERYKQLTQILIQFCPESDQKDIKRFARDLVNTILPESRRVAQFEVDFEPIDQMINTFNIILKDPDQHTNLRSIIESLLALDYDFFQQLNSCKWMLDNIEQHYTGYYKKVLGLEDIEYRAKYIKTCYESVQKRFIHPFLSILHLSKYEDAQLAMLGSQFKHTQSPISMLFTRIQNMDHSVKYQTIQICPLPDEVHDMLKLCILLDEVFRYSIQQILKPEITISNVSGNYLCTLRPDNARFVLKRINDGIFQIAPNVLKVHNSMRLSDPGIVHTLTKAGKLAEAENSAIEFITVGGTYPLNESMDPIKLNLTLVMNPCYFKFVQSRTHYEEHLRGGCDNIFYVYGSGLRIGILDILTLNDLNLNTDYNYLVGDLMDLIPKDFKSRILRVQCVNPYIHQINLNSYSSLTLEKQLSKAIEDVSKCAGDMPDHSRPDAIS